MQMKLSTKIFLFGSGFLYILLCFPFAKYAIGNDLVFYKQSKEGWFWYHDPLLPSEPHEKKRKSKKRQLPSLKNYTANQLWNMYPDDFQELLNVLQKKAVQAPTERNITEYLAMQDIARRKAVAYASATMYVAQKKSDIFGINQVYPTTAPGVAAKTNMQSRETRETILSAKNNYALIFFVKQGCGFCKKQEAILSYFEDKYGWSIKKVDIDRRPGAALRFNIRVTPTLLLVKKGQDNYMTVSSGVVALSTLERNLFRSIRYMNGDTGKDNYFLFDYEKGSPKDPSSILNKGPQPWVQQVFN